MTSGARAVVWHGPDRVRLVGERVGDGPLVVLLHGGFQTRGSWRTAVTQLSGEGFSVLSYDLRGHGESGRSPDGAYRVGLHADDLRALLEEVGEPAALVGASLGGAASLVTAGDPSPAVRGQVAALVIVDIVPRLEKVGRDRIATFMGAHLDGFESIEEAAELVAAYVGGPPRPGGGLTRSLRQGDDGRYRWHWDPALLAAGFDGYAEDSIQASLAAARRLETPTLLLRGELSDVVVASGVAEFLDAVPEATYQEIPGVGHMVAAVPNNPFVTAISGYLTALLQPPGDTP